MPSGGDDEDEEGGRPPLTDPVARREAPLPRDLFEEESVEDVEIDEIDGRGGFPVLPRPNLPAIELSPLDRREVCPAHGWVGRTVFQRDRHDLCVAAYAERTCPACSGSGRAGPGRCPSCDGTGHLAEAAEDLDGDDEIDTDAELGADVDEEDEADRVPQVQLRQGSRTWRNPKGSRPSSIAVKRLTVEYLRTEERRIQRFVASPEYAELIAHKPRTRGDCKDGPRPCAWVSCKHHLYLEVNPETGSIKLNFPDRDLDELSATCVLDVADQGWHTLEEVGEHSNNTRERVRQLEVKGLMKLKMAIADRESETNTDDAEEDDDAADES